MPPIKIKEIPKLIFFCFYFPVFFCHSICSVPWKVHICSSSPFNKFQKTSAPFYWYNRPPFSYAVVLSLHVFCFSYEILVLPCPFPFGFCGGPAPLSFEFLACLLWLLMVCVFAVWFFLIDMIARFFAFFTFVISSFHLCVICIYCVNHTFEIWNSHSQSVTHMHAVQKQNTYSPSAGLILCSHFLCVFILFFTWSLHRNVVFKGFESIIVEMKG